MWLWMQATVFCSCLRANAFRLRYIEMLSLNQACITKDRWAAARMGSSLLVRDINPFLMDGTVWELSISEKSTRTPKLQTDLTSCGNSFKFLSLTGIFLCKPYGQKLQRRKNHCDRFLEYSRELWGRCVPLTPPPGLSLTMLCWWQTANPSRCLLSHSP